MALKLSKIKIAVIILGTFSLLTIFGLSLAWQNKTFFFRQANFYFFGFLLFLIISKIININYLKHNKIFIFFLYFLTILLLVFVLIQPHRVQNIKGWINIGSFYFQPSELAKFILVLVLAKYFSKRHIEIWRWRHTIISGIYFILLGGLVAIEPDLGNAIILFFLWASILLVAGVRFKQVLIISLVSFLFASLAWQSLLKPYQKQRILSFISPQEDVLGAHYQANQAKIAIGEGGLFGTGLAGGIQTEYKFLPQAHSDFIFASFAEMWGFLGVLVLFAVYLFLFVELFKKIKSLEKGEKNFEKLIIFGYMAFLFVQIVIHIGGNLDLLPITGITLPFLSYGGSSLLINFLFLGIIEAS